MTASEPPVYPRIPHLVAGRGTSDDETLGRSEVAALLSGPVLVEEKLDGANVVLWICDGAVVCALRSGVGGMDRGRQLGPLRAWIAERHDQLLSALVDVSAVYAEWLLLSHTIAYDQLDSYLVVLDVLDLRGVLVTPQVRDRWAETAGLPSPPVLRTGRVAGGVRGLEQLLACSRLGSEPMEGLVVRTVDGSEPRVAKLVRAGFVPIGPEAWRTGRPYNQRKDRELSWH